MDAKQGMNLGGVGNLNSSLSNTKNLIGEIANAFRSQLLPALEAAGFKAGKIGDLLRPGGKGYDPYNSTKIASNANDNQLGGGKTWGGVPSRDENGQFIIAAGPQTQLQSKIGDFVNDPRKMAVAAGALTYTRAVGAGIMNAMPTTNQYVQQDMLTNRARFYGMGRQDTSSTFIDANGNPVGFKMGGDSNGISSANNNVTNLQNTMNMRGTMSPGDLLDAAKALSAAQAMGMAGASNFNQLAIGASVMSNITPGVGITKSMQAQGAMQQASNVNAMMGIGIHLRGPNGQMESVPQVVDQIWNKLNAGKRGGSSITENDILLSMEPGNAIDSMLNMYFGNDEILRKQVGDALIIKARSGGAPIDSLTKKQLQDMGVSTAAVNSLSNRNARASRVLQQTAGAGAAGFTASNDVAAQLSQIADALTPLADIAAALGTTRSTNSGIGGGLLKTLVVGAGSLLGGIFGGPLGAIVGGTVSSAFFKEKGGTVDGKVPYIVGEKGPELFVPSSDGIVVPNNLTSGIARKNGGAVKSGGANGINPNAQELFRFLTSNGLSENAATGVIGNLVGESGLRPSALGDNKSSYGIAQWHLGRWDNLKKFAKSNGGDPSSLDIQEKFLLAEMRSKNQSDLWSALSDPSISEGNAAAVFMRKFEIPKDQSDAAAQKRADLGAKAMSGEWQGSTNVTSSGVTPNANGASFNKPITNLQELLANHGQNANLSSFFKAPSNQNTYNFGGITIAVNGNQNPDSIKAALKSIINDPTAHLGSY